MTLETAVVGGGVDAERHLTGLKHCPGTTLTAICDPDETRARERATEYDITAYADFEGLLARESLDWLHLCTPPQTHLELVRMALEDDVAVQLPTPATASVAEAEQLQRLVADHDAQVSLAHRRAFSPAMRNARDLLAEGAVGELQSVSLICTEPGRNADKGPGRGPGRAGPVGLAGSERLARPISLLLHLAGSPNGSSSLRTAPSATSDAERTDYETVQFNYTTADGVTCNATVLPNDVPHRSLQLHGTRGRLEVDLVTQSVTTVNSTERTTSAERAKGNAQRALGRAHAAADHGLSAAKRAIRDDWETMRQLDGHCYQLGEEATAIQNDEQMPVPVETGTWTLRIMDAITAQQYEQRADPKVRLGTDSI